VAGFPHATVVVGEVGGFSSAALATVAIVLPGFVPVADPHALSPRLREPRWASRFLDGVRIAAAGWMPSVTIIRDRSERTRPLFIAFAAAAAIALIAWRVNPAWASSPVA
jgi:chromate transport protein ChrA